MKNELTHDVVKIYDANEICVPLACMPEDIANANIFVFSDQHLPFYTILIVIE